MNTAHSGDPILSLKQAVTEAGLWGKSKVLSRGTFLKVHGSTDTNLYYIKEGAIRIFFQEQDEEKTIRLAYQHNFIAALDSYFSARPSDLYMQALRKTEVKVISKKRFEDFLKSNPLLSDIWHQVLGQLVVQSLEREKDILIDNPRLRYERVLKRSPQLFQEIPNKYIANYLRMTPETLSRLKSNS